MKKLLAVGPALDGPRARDPGGRLGEEAGAARRARREAQPQRPPDRDAGRRELAARPSEPEKEKDVFTRDAEEKLTRTLRSKVEIDRKRRGGVIHIRFGSEDELIRLVDELMGRRRETMKGKSGELNGFLDRGSSFKGELEFEDTMRIDGKFNGKITRRTS